MQSFVGLPSRARLLSLTVSALVQAAFLGLIYIVLILVLPANNQTIVGYHLSTTGYHVMHLAIALPSILVWMAAFAGARTMRHYAVLVKSTPEGKSYARLAFGISCLAWNLPVSSLVSLITAGIAYRWPGFHPSAIIVTNYVSLALRLAGFTYIGLAGHNLLRNSKLHYKVSNARLLALVFSIIGVLYCYLTFSYFHLTGYGSSINSYYLPFWILVLTIIIPYLYVWYVGLLAVYELRLFCLKISGVLYRRALYWLVSGLTIIVISSITLQYFNGVEPHTGHVLLDYRLVLLVVFRIINGLGFLVLTQGALSLKKIEEV